MKVGILTLSIHGNYGGVLQNFALSTVLKRQQISSITIDYKTQRHQRLKIRVFRLLRKFGGVIRGIGYINPKFAFLYHIRNFADSHISFTEVLSTKKKLEEVAKNCDAVVVGSDQVWRYIFIYDDVSSFFLDFVKNNHTKKIAYAASVGVSFNEYPDKDLQIVRQLYPKFDAVSVREKSSVELIKDLWSSYPEALHVVDPTMLLSPDDYKNIINDAHVKETDAGQLFYYVLDMTKEKMGGIQNIAYALALKPYTIYSPDKHMLKRILKSGFTQKVEQWLACILNADFVVTDSFHGCVFCILFNRQFVVYGNKERGMDRFTSLLGLFGLEDRIVDENDPIEHFQKLPNIDYKKVNKILDEERRKSLEFLINNLK